MPRASAPGTAAVATQLLAFLREPARYRARFTVGREAIEGGHHVLRFAYGKLPEMEAEGITREELHEAAIAFVRQVCLWDGATYYQVLCLPENAPRGAVKANYRLLMALIHPDRPDATLDPWPADAAQRANRAYEILSDEARRREYDAELARRREAGSIHAPSGAPRAVREEAPRRWPRRLA
ncbi:MAG TPA: J domain-containing protein, partial [Usitatibacter sp.]|nr:J domain-containing protein [Usitatibacter sp.]